jgi:hypothetical protein
MNIDGGAFTAVTSSLMYSLAFWQKNTIVVLEELMQVLFALKLLL